MLAEHGMPTDCDCIYCDTMKQNVWAADLFPISAAEANLDVKANVEESHSGLACTATNSVLSIFESRPARADQYFPTS